MAHVDMKTGSLWQRFLSGGSGAIWAATIVLFALSPVIAPGSLASGSLLGMLPFAAVLAIAAAGQTLVIQQRGLDLSVPGMMAFGAMLVTCLPSLFHVPLPLAVVAAIVLPGLAGILSGVLVTRLAVMPLVATLGMNAVLLGVVFAVTTGTPVGAAPGLVRFATASVWSVPSSVIVAIVVVGATGLINLRSIIGRRLTALGVSEPAAVVAGIRATGYQTLAYGFAGAQYGVAAVLYAGYVQTPPLFFGDGYLLPTVAAVVLGGTALSGGRAAIVASGVAALFLTQLGQLLRAAGLPEAVQLICQALVLLGVVILRELVPILAQALRHLARRPARAAS